jgi:hypothetical protein
VLDNCGKITTLSITFINKSKQGLDMKIFHTVMTHPTNSSGNFSGWIQQRFEEMRVEKRANATLGMFRQENENGDAVTVHAWRTFVDQAACDDWENFFRTELELFGGSLDRIEVLDYDPAGTLTPPSYNPPA